MTFEASLSWEVRKQSGVHITPLELARFVANQTMLACRNRSHLNSISILDPAVGDAALLDAILEFVPASLKVRVVGFDTSPEAVQQATARISGSVRPNIACEFRQGDFLEHVLTRYDGNISADLFPSPQEQFDIVISNPPYVRTQVLGAEKSQLIARRFGLTGRVDIYYAFLEAIARVLRVGGIAGIIVSNRFMTVKSGAVIRKKLRKLFNILHVWDLGDTKLFAAAVLPAVVLLERKGDESNQMTTHFTSIYSSRSDGPSVHVESPIEALEKDGLVQLADGATFMVRQGWLEHTEHLDDVWKVSEERLQTHLSMVSAHTSCLFADLGKVRVGVKTTADKVFIRDDWDTLPDHLRPELLRPLLTHHDARRYRALSGSNSRKILYPHEVVAGRRQPCDLTMYPRSAAYLEQHRNVLEARTYVKQSGRRWYELWVPQNPDIWSGPKLVFRDISEKPTFWLDLSGAVVNGDCYWLPVKDQNEPRMWLALAVANSSFIEWYYDVQFNNKLYAGRRRFMSQYVERFPLPKADTVIVRDLVELTKRLYDSIDNFTAASLDASVNSLVWQAFGLSPEEVRW
jgi:SAM-dependent methyltransferase